MLLRIRIRSIGIGVAVDVFLLELGVQACYFAWLEHAAAFNASSGLRCGAIASRQKFWLVGAHDLT